MLNATSGDTGHADIVSAIFCYSLSASHPSTNPILAAFNAKTNRIVMPISNFIQTQTQIFFSVSTNTVVPIRNIRYNLSKQLNKIYITKV